MSVYAFDTTHVWVQVEDNPGSNPRFSEAWACQTSPCSSAANWSDKKQVTGAWLGFVLGLSSNSNVAFIYGNTVGGAGTFSVTTTNNGGTTWTTAVTTVNSFGTAIPAPTDGNCVAIGSTVYCVAFKSDGKTLYFLKFVQGGASWTETGIVTFASTTNFFATLSTDGTNMATFYNSATSTTLDFQTSTNVGSTWSGDAVWVSGEASSIQYVTSTPKLQSSTAGVMWAVATSGNIRFAISAAVSSPEGEAPSYVWLLFVPVVILVLLIKRRI